MSILNGESVKWRKMERRKYEKKKQHLKLIRDEEENRRLETCPAEVIEYKNAIVFNKEIMNKMKKEEVKVETVGEVELDGDEIALLKLPPKFAIRKQLDSLDMMTDLEMGVAKIRYQTHKENSVRDVEESDELEGMKRRKKLDKNELEELDKMEILDAEGRRVYDPINKSFDHGNKRSTDLMENKKVTLPKPCDSFVESSIEMLKGRIMKAFEDYKKKHCNDKGHQKTNLTMKEQRGLRKLRKRIANKEIVILKTDKSGKLTPMKRDLYEKMGSENCSNDEKIDREEVRRIERRLNDQVKIWTKMLNSGLNHGHLERVMKSKLCSSENSAPKYYMVKDHKIEGGYRPVVGGCNSDTLGLSNTLSEVVESVCNAVNTPFEVISSEDLLRRAQECNESLKELKDNNTDENWHWTQDYVLLGSDVKALFPSLSAKKTGIACRKQIEKSEISWENVNWRLVAMYVKLHENYWTENELKDVRLYLPKRKSIQGRPPSIGTIDVESRFEWPSTIEYVGDKIKAKLMGLAIERAVVFFFNNFTYTFGGQVYRQKGGDQ